ncbi:hypothetical protein LINPERHAP1_LOCUS10383 [Linum perenne]
MSVSRKSSSHFIFLKASQLQWLDGVLRVAEGWKWFIPGGVLHPHSCLRSNGGWSPLQDLFKIYRNAQTIPTPPSLVFGTRFFTEVTAVRVLSSNERCGDTQVEGEVMIQAEAEGVDDLRAFLEKCLVFRLKEGIPIPWTRFRQWMLINWGVTLNATCHSLGNDLWLLVCGSSMKVDRILDLKRFSFKDSTILVDRWIAMAGRSSVLQENDMTWVNVHGIPLHLRSTALFEKIGD